MVISTYRDVVCVLAQIIEANLGLVVEGAVLNEAQVGGYLHPVMRRHHVPRGHHEGRVVVRDLRRIHRVDRRALVGQGQIQGFQIWPFHRIANVNSLVKGGHFKESEGDIFGGLI